MNTRYRLFATIAGSAIALDQLTKLWARHSLPVTPSGRGIPVPVIDGFWDWILDFNTGSAFSMFSGGVGSRVLLSFVAVGALGVMLYLLRGAREDQRGLVVALGLMAGGAIGNLIDRIAAGRVTDFVLWHFGESFYWPVFNIADIALVLAVPLFLYFGYRAEKEQKVAKAAAETNA